MQRTVADARGRTSRNGVLFAVIAVVSIAIASVVGVFAWQTVSLGRTVPDLNTADPAVGYAFYAALGQALTDGDPGSLQRIVTADFVDHDGSDGPTQDINGLNAALSAFGATFPHAVISVQSIEASGDSLIAQISPGALTDASVARLTIAPIQTAERVEVLRIRHGRVSERWAARLPQVRATTFAVGSTTSYTGGPTDAWLYRMTVPPGGELDWASGLLSAVMVEAGTLSLTTTKADELGALQSETVSISAGEAVLLSHEAQVRFQSGDASETRVLLLDARSSQDQSFTPFKRLGGATSKLLWHTGESIPIGTPIQRGMPFQLDEPWRLEIGRLELPAGIEITLANPAGLETVLEAENAPIHLSTDDGSVSHLETSYSLGPLDPPGVVDANTAAQLTGVSGLQIRGSESTASTIWVMTFGPPQPMPNGDAPDLQRPTGQQGQP